MYSEESAPVCRYVIVIEIFQRLCITCLEGRNLFVDFTIEFFNYLSVVAKRILVAPASNNITDLIQRIDQANALTGDTFWIMEL
jgi:hypothetical protein